MDSNTMEDESFSWINHIKENFFGILLLILAVVIICVVEYITRINALFFPISSPIPGITASSMAPSTSFTKPVKTKGKKFKK
jgi:hypothetical protein